MLKQEVMDLLHHANSQMTNESNQVSSRELDRIAADYMKMLPGVQGGSHRGENGLHYQGYAITRRSAITPVFLSKYLKMTSNGLDVFEKDSINRDAKTTIFTATKTLHSNKGLVDDLVALNVELSDGAITIASINEANIHSHTFSLDRLPEAFLPKLKHLKITMHSVLHDVGKAKQQEVSQC